MDTIENNNSGLPTWVQVVSIPVAFIYHNLEDVEWFDLYHGAADTVIVTCAVIVGVWKAYEVCVKIRKKYLKWREGDKYTGI